VIEHYGQNPDLKTLGVTATPDRHDEEALGQVFDSVAYDYELLDAIHDGWLVPIRQRAVVVDGLDYSSIRTTAGDLNGADLARVMEYEEMLHAVASPALEFRGDMEGARKAAAEMPFGIGQIVQELQPVVDNLMRKIVFMFSGIGHLSGGDAAVVPEGLFGASGGARGSVLSGGAGVSGRGRPRGATLAGRANPAPTELGEACAGCAAFERTTVAVAVAIVKMRTTTIATTTGARLRWAVSSATICLQANSRSAWVQPQGGSALGTPLTVARAR
jgi:hypothetical protein